MDLSISGQRKRIVQAANTAPQAERKAAAAAAKPKTDKAAWSQAALSFIQELNRQDMEKQRRAQEKRQRGDADLEMLEKSLKVADKCRKIASRIMKGDKVPPQDEKFLQEADPDGYKLAIACRVPKEKPKEWESVLEDEEENASDSGGEAAEGAEPSGEAAESSGGAGEA